MLVLRWEDFVYTLPFTKTKLTIQHCVCSTKLSHSALFDQSNKYAGFLNSSVSKIEKKFWICTKYPFIQKETQKDQFFSMPILFEWLKWRINDVSSPKKQNVFILYWNRYTYFIQRQRIRTRIEISFLGENFQSGRFVLDWASTTNL